jgi:outer membrane protein assembly factor BamB
MKCYNTHHTSRSPYSTSHITNLEKWRYKCGEGVDSGICIDKEGILFFGDTHWYVKALYPNGTLKWQYRTGNRITSTPALGEDGTLYVGSWDTNLYAFNSKTGSLNWIVSAHGGSITTSPAIGEDGAIYLGTAKGIGDGEIVAIYPNGTLKWIYPTGDYIYSDPAIGDDGTIYIGSDDNYFYAINPNGTLKWRYKTGHHIKAPPSIGDDGTIYIPSYDDYLYAFNLNGTLKWKCKDAGAATNPSIGDDGTIYLSDYKKFHSVYPNGTKKWTINLGGERHIDASSCAISADGTIYVGTNIGESAGGEIVAINDNGTERWRKKIANWWVESSPSIGEDGTIYIGSQSEGRGYLHAFGPVESNSPPELPTISGPINGKIREEYAYKLTVIDPDNNPISFFIDWGDGTNTGWTFERASGEKCYYGHIWNKKGNYTIRVKARDTLGEESNWTYLEVTMPKSKQFNNILFLRFLENHPRISQVLKYLLHLR